MNLGDNHIPYLSIKLPLGKVDSVIAQLAKNTETAELATQLLEGRKKLFESKYTIVCHYMGVHDRKFQHPCGNYEDTFNALVKLQEKAKDTVTYQMVRVEG